MVFVILEFDKYEQNRAMENVDKNPLLTPLRSTNSYQQFNIRISCFEVQKLFRLICCGIKKQLIKNPNKTTTITKLFCGRNLSKSEKYVVAMITNALKCVFCLKKLLKPRYKLFLFSALA